MKKNNKKKQKMYMTYSVVVRLSVCALRQMYLVPMSNVDVLNNVEVYTHTHTYTNNRSIFFSLYTGYIYTFCWYTYNSIFVDYYCYSAGSKEQQIHREKNLEGIGEK